MPAHDEEAVIRSTLASIRSQLAEGDRLLVIADNCSDTTARIAAECGAEVLERNDLERRGKGYALQSGVERLKSQPIRRDVVVVIDADCKLMPGCLDALAAQVAAYIAAGPSLLPDDAAPGSAGDRCHLFAGRARQE